MKVVVVASGSGGNATLFEHDGTRVLVDAGIGPRTLAQRLAEAGSPGPPHAIVITHAHGDHIGCADRCARSLNIPVYLSESTRRVVRLDSAPTVRVFGARHPFQIGSLTFSPLPVPHDAAQVALVVSGGGRSAAIVTDLGEVPPALAGHLASCDALFIESNHDVEMLARGPYLPHLKRRVGSSRGHLSNAQTHELLRHLSRTTHTVVLMHLSLVNNRPDLALESAGDALSGRRVRLVAARPTEPLVFDVAAPPPPPLAMRGKPVQLPLF